MSIGFIYMKLLYGLGSQFPTCSVFSLGIYLQKKKNSIPRLLFSPLCVWILLVLSCVQPKVSRVGEANHRGEGAIPSTLESQTKYLPPWPNLPHFLTSSVANYTVCPLMEVKPPTPCITAQLLQVLQILPVIPNPPGGRKRYTGKADGNCVSTRYFVKSKHSFPKTSHPQPQWNTGQWSEA